MLLYVYHVQEARGHYKATAVVSERIVDQTIAAATWRRLIRDSDDSNCRRKMFIHCVAILSQEYLEDTSSVTITHVGTGKAE